MFAIFIVLLLIGVPISFSIGISSLVMMLAEGIPVTMLITKMFGGLDSFTILAIPFYILTGAIMNSGNLTGRLVRFADSLVGHIKGGLAHVNVLASMFFAGISGSSTADSASIGAMLIPARKAMISGLPRRLPRPPPPSGQLSRRALCLSCTAH